MKHRVLSYRIEFWDVPYEPDTHSGALAMDEHGQSFKLLMSGAFRLKNPPSTKGTFSQELKWVEVPDELPEITDEDIEDEGIWEPDNE
jgi:hypothetical protein